MLKISIIIPYHSQETTHHTLIDFFQNLNDDSFEIIPITGTSRANAMNNGARKAQNNFLWFVHADTTLNSHHIENLKKSLTNYPRRIHYFDLKFDGNFLTKINSIGANIRSRIFKLPWGDQAFCLSKENFCKLGKYDETVRYGEDHLLIWKAHQKRIKLKRIPATLTSSAREYTKQGWFNLTFKRQYLWIKQAAPEFIKWVKS